jgi:glycosyltransferase involved in cell wall biosynthesis
MRILQLCKKFPYPLRDGESIAVTYLSRAMVEQGCEITLLSMNTPKHYIDLNKIPQDYNHYKEIHCAEVDNGIKPLEAFKNLFSNESYHVQRFISDDYKQKLIELVTTNDYDVIQLETLYLTPYIETIKKHSNAIVTMRSHNIEFEIWERITENTSFWLKRLYLKHLTKKLRNYELETLNDYDYLVAVSNRDLQKFKKLGYNNGAMSTPIGLEMKNYLDIKKAKEHAQAICFIGAMDWVPNREGLEWFLDNVWPTFHQKNPTIEFHIAGRNTPKELLKRSIPGVKFLGEVPDAIEFINSYPLMVVPLFSGSGTRVKILEGMALSKTIVSTSLGKEGIEGEDGKHFLVADDAKTFVKALSYALDHPDEMKQIGQSAHEFVTTYYDHTEIAKKLISKYEYLVAHPYQS